MNLQNWGLIFAGILIGFGIGIWFALKFRSKKDKLIIEKD